MVTQGKEDEGPSQNFSVTGATQWESGVCACVYDNLNVAKKPKFN